MSREMAVWTWRAMAVERKREQCRHRRRYFSIGNVDSKGVLKRSAAEDGGGGKAADSRWLSAHRDGAGGWHLEESAAAEA
jgi:hypothetical protein